MTENKTLGNLGEKIAKEYLTKSGYTFLYQNYISDKLELDLIFTFKTSLIFVEVKSRLKTIESLQENPLSARQTRNLKYAMASYCSNRKINFEKAQLDLIIVLIDKKTQSASLKHYRDIL